MAPHPTLSPRCRTGNVNPHKNGPPLPDPLLRLYVFSAHGNEHPFVATFVATFVDPCTLRLRLRRRRRQRGNMSRMTLNTCSLWGEERENSSHTLRKFLHRVRMSVAVESNKVHSGTVGLASSSRRDTAKMARRFNAGNTIRTDWSPEGTAEI